MHGTNNSFRLHWPSPSMVASTPRQGRSKWLRTGATIVGGIIGLIALTALAATAYESIASTGDAAHYAPAGRFVDVGGYRLHLDCRGTGSPTVVMDAGLGGSSLDWTLVQNELATSTRVCTFDRAGMGWSEPGPAPRTPGHLAGELWSLLTNAGVDGPYLLVGHSLAGKNARMFALAHPQAVAGMVLVDARSEYVDANTSEQDADAFSIALQTQATIYSIARHLGIARLFGASLADQPLVATDTATEMVLLQTQPAAIDETLSEGLARTADDGVLATATLGTMPLVVIAASDSLQNTPNWPEAQKRLVGLSTKSEFVEATSRHYVQLEDPNAVTDAVLRVLARARNEL